MFDVEGLSITAARQMAVTYYAGDSPPISEVTSETSKDLMSLAWWQSQERTEALTDRHKAALKLYVDLASRISKFSCQSSFPPMFRFGRYALRPDKGVIKAMTLTDPPILVADLINKVLVFRLTKWGSDWIAEDA